MWPRLHLLLTATLGAATLLLDPAPAAAKPADMRRLRVTDHGVYGTVNGAEVKLSLDPDLQKAAERILAQSGAHEGAIVASDVRTGRILAWASRGSRDFVAEPFAPSASLFKVVTASALLEGGKVTPATRACYDGGEREIKPADLEQKGKHCTNVGEALGHSINLVFARLAQKHLRSSDLRRYAGELGFVGEVPIDVPVGSSTLQIPDDPFGMARASAGFWNGKLSPLGALFAMQVIANDGEKIGLYLRDKGQRTSRGRAMSGSTARSLAHMLEITTRRGTAAKAFKKPDGSRALPSIPVAAKTGTLIGGHPARMYSWFAAFAPSTKPEIAVSVMLANNLKWKTKGNVVGRELLEAYFNKEVPGRVAHKANKGDKRKR